MATQTVTLACTASAIIDSKYPSTNKHGSYERWGYGYNSTNTQIAYLLLKFDAFPSAYKYKQLISSDIVLHGVYDNDRYKGASFYELKGAFDESTVTYSNWPNTVYGSSFSSFTLPDGSGEYTTSTGADPEDTRTLLRCTYGIAGACILPISSPLNTSAYMDVYLRTATASKRPTLVVQFSTDDVDITIAANNAPTSGYVNPRTSTSFGWVYKRPTSQYCVAEFTQDGAALHWKVSGAGTENIVNVASTTKTATIPANTFPVASTIEWYVVGTRDDGVTYTSPTYSFSTEAAAITSTPVSPVDTIEDNSAGIAFSWSSVSSDGFAQSAAQLQYSTDGTNWSSLASVADSSTSVTVAGGTLPSGTVYWRVRGANIDGTYGSWSSSVSFVSYGAPAAPVVTSTSTSYPVITWQAAVQEAYKITIDGTVYGPYFGTTKTFTPDDYLEDGNHTIEVQVQNSFGLWSAAGTVSITIETPSGYAVPQITYSKFDVDGLINWSISNATTTTAVYVYRDNVKIASLNFTDGSGTFTDTHVLGQHSYKIVQNYLGYALVSNIVTGTMKSCTTRIMPLAGGSWLELELSDNSNRTEEFSYSKYVSLRHFSGSQWPVAEIGVSADEACTYDVSFPDVASANAFEQLRGTAVIIKSRGGQVMVGILSDLQKSMTEFYIRFQFNVQRIWWEDFVDETS